MRKYLLIISILFVSVISTACVNKFAVQELNNNAKDLMAEGKTEVAVSRLESSIDLEPDVFETHYNLAVAYMDLKKYDDALKSLQKVNELKPDFADAYHSIAVINEEKAYEIIDGDKDNNSTDTQQTETSDTTQKPKDLSESDKTSICDYYGLAIDNYNKYLMKKTDAADKDKVNQKIDDLNKELRKYSSTAEEVDDSVMVE